MFLLGGGATAPRISPDFPHKVLKDTAPQTTGAVVPPDFPWPLGAKPAHNWFQMLDMHTHGLVGSWGYANEHYNKFKRGRL